MCYLRLCLDFCPEKLFKLVPTFLIVLYLPITTKHNNFVRKLKPVVLFSVHWPRKHNIISGLGGNYLKSQSSSFVLQFGKDFVQLAIYSDNDLPCPNLKASVSCDTVSINLNCFRFTKKLAAKILRSFGHQSYSLQRIHMAIDWYKKTFTFWSFIPFDLVPVELERFVLTPILLFCLLIWCNSHASNLFRTFRIVLEALK